MLLRYAQATLFLLPLSVCYLLFFLPIYAFVLGFHSLRIIVSPLLTLKSANLISNFFLSSFTARKYFGQIFFSIVAIPLIRDSTIFENCGIFIMPPRHYNIVRNTPSLIFQVRTKSQIHSDSDQVYGNVRLYFGIYHYRISCRYTYISGARVLKGCAV